MIRSRLAGWMVRCATTGGLAVGVAALSGCVVYAGDSWSATDHVRRTDSLEVDHVDAAPIDVTGRNGTVEIVAEPSADRVSITATVQAKTQERLDATTIYAERDANGTLVLKAIFPDDKPENGEGVAFRVLIPSANGVRARTSNGSVTIAGLSGEADLTASNGTIRVDSHDGPLTAKTSNAPIEASGVSGNATLTTSNGRVVASGVGGTVSITTSNAPVTATLAHDTPLALITTSNGRIELRVPASARANVSAATSNGQVSVLRNGETTRHGTSARLELNGGGSSITANTVNAPILIEVIDSGRKQD